LFKRQISTLSIIHYLRPHIQPHDTRYDHGDTEEFDGVDGFVEKNNPDDRDKERAKSTPQCVRDRYVDFRQTHVETNHTAG
jgi:hypothetical protein